MVFSTKQYRSKSATEFWLRCELTNNGQTACMLFACFHFDKYVWMDCNMCVALPLLHLYTHKHKIRTHIQIRSKHKHIEITKRHSIWPRIIKNKWYEKQANIFARLISHRIVNGRVAWNFLHVFVYLVHTMTEVCFECASSGVCVYISRKHVRAPQPFCIVYRQCMWYIHIVKEKNCKWGVCRWEMQ